jgi:hypothetical protein
MTAKAEGEEQKQQRRRKSPGCPFLAGNRDILDPPRRIQDDVKEKGNFKSPGATKRPCSPRSLNAGLFCDDGVDLLAERKNPRVRRTRATGSKAKIIPPPQEDQNG